MQGAPGLPQQAHPPPRRPILSHGPRAWLIEGLILAALLLAWAVGAAQPRHEPLHHAIDLTRLELLPPAQYAGIHSLELNQSFAYRWTTGSFLLQLPWAYHQAPTYLATVRARAGLPDPAPLTFSANERPLVTVTPEASFRLYHFLLPPPPPADANLRLGMQTEARTLPPDVRPLGVIVTGITLQGLAALDGLTLAIVGFGLTGLWLLARLRGASIGGALLLCGPLALALLVLYRLQGLAPLAYPTMAAFSLAAAAAATLLTRSSPIRLGLAMLGTLVSFSSMLWTSWLSDDAFISFRYAQNLVAGYGLVYNPGERVEGYTNFLYTLLAALLLWLGGEPVLWSYLLGVALALLLLLLTYALATHLIGLPWGLVAALFVGTSQSLLIHSARGGGLETALYAVLLLAAAAVYLWPTAALTPQPTGPLTLALTGLLLALATLTRPEGALLLALTILHALVADLHMAELRRPHGLRMFLRRKLGLGALLGPYLLVIGPFFIARYSYYGDLLPNTFYAKTGGGLRALPRGLAYSWDFAQTMGGPFLLLGLVGLIRGRTAALRGWRGYFLLLISVYTAYIISVGGDHFLGERFFVPLVALIAILVADGLAILMRAALARPALRLAAIPLLVLVLSLYSTMALTRTREDDYILQGMDESLAIWRELGWWMADHTAPDESIAVMGAGAIAFYGQRPTIDMLGLTDRHIARVVVPAMGAGTAGHEKRDPDYVLNQRRPTYIPDMWADYFPDRAALQADYDLVTITTRYGRELLLWKRR